MDLGELRSLTEQVIKKDEELANARKEWQLTFDSVPDLIAIMDVSFKIKRVNRSMANALHMHPEEITGKNCFDLIHNEKMPIMACPVVKMFETTGTVIQEVFEPALGGWFEVTVTPLYNDVSDIIGFVHIARDINQRIQSQKDLMNSEARYHRISKMLRLMCDNMPDMIWAKDLNNKYVFANKSLCEKLLNADSWRDVVGKSDLFFADRERESHPENSKWHTFGELCVNSDLITLENKVSQQFDEYGNVKGEFLYLDVHKAPFVDEFNNVIGTVGSARDITKQKQLETELIESNINLEAHIQELSATEEELRDQVQRLESNQNYLSSLFNNLPVPVFYKSIDGIYRDCNPAFCAAYGASKDYIVGKDVYQLYPEHATDFVYKDNELLSSGGVQQYFHEVFDRNFNVHNTMIVKTPHRDYTGTIVGIIGCIIDVTPATGLVNHHIEAMYRDHLQGL